MEICTLGVVCEKSIISRVFLYPKLGGNLLFKSNYNLMELGWNDSLQEEFKNFKDEYMVGRIAVEYKGSYKMYTKIGEVSGSISGKMNYKSSKREDYPAVGDWVLIDKFNNLHETVVIHRILNRKSKISRKVAGSSFDEQIVAVNIDILFICMSLNDNFNLRRLERYVTTAWNSGALPVIVLTKTDLCTDLREKIIKTESVAPGIDIVNTSCFNTLDMDKLRRYLGTGKTAAFVGSSGVGKSTIINNLLEEEKQKTNIVSNIESKGKHTTTNRELIVLESGGIVIDTPGMRELHLFDAEDGFDNSFEDINELAKNCKFSDCTHTFEPKCAVQKAIEDGVMPKERYNSYLKLKKEAEFMKRKLDKKAQSDHKNKIKAINKELKRRYQ